MDADQRRESTREQGTGTVEEVVLSFTGFGADTGILDAHDLSRALEGWRTYWLISAAIFHNREFSSKQCPDDLRPQIKVRAIERGSFDVIGDVVFPVSIMVAYDVVKALWKWRKALAKRHIRNKKEFFTREQALEALRLLAKDYEVSVEGRSEAVKAMDAIDDALRDFTEPIERSANRMMLKSSSGTSPMSFTVKDRRALHSGYYVDPSEHSGGFEKCSVRFIRINTETGNALVAFDNPQGVHQMGHEYSRVIDPSVARPRNIYTHALYQDQSLEVWARMVRSQKSNNFVRWEITANPPVEHLPLLDGV